MVSVAVKVPVDESDVSGDAAIGREGSDQPARIGTPYVKGAFVTASVVGPVRGERIHIHKFRRRKGYRRKAGHRQHYTELRIDSIVG